MCNKDLQIFIVHKEYQEQVEFTKEVLTKAEMEGDNNGIIQLGENIKLGNIKICGKVGDRDVTLLINYSAT